MITYIIIGVTVLVSFLCFQNRQLASQLQFSPALFVHKKEYYRILSLAFVHADWNHLLVNMFVLYFFGTATEHFFAYYLGSLHSVYFVALYFGSVIFSNLWSLQKHKNNYNYNAVGASGAVAATLFAFIFFAPWEMIYFFGIIPIPGILFGVGYLLYSYKMTKQNNDHIAHDAHLLGAIFGFIFPILLKPSLFSHFVEKLFAIFQ